VRLRHQLHDLIFVAPSAELSVILSHHEGQATMRHFTAVIAALSLVLVGFAGPSVSEPAPQER
jgi:hypothetical protein